MSFTLNDLGVRADWYVREGCTWAKQMTASTGGPVGEGGTPVNITSYTISAEVTAGPTSDTALKTFSVTKPNAAGGVFRIEIDEVAADLAPGTYWWSLQWNTGSDDVPLCAGSFVVKEWTQ